MMNDTVNVVLIHEHNQAKAEGLQKILVPLKDNPHITPLMDESDDLICTDIEDIPRICADIQKTWKYVGLNRFALLPFTFTFSNAYKSV
ncbi:MAG: hypothetical protein ACI8RD_008601 [Bacillariaceae sp.]|jgi:hypothetical protein